MAASFQRRLMGVAGACVFAFAGAVALADEKDPHAGHGHGGSRGGHGAHGQPGDEAAAAGAKIGEKAPDFTLKDTEGKEHHLADYTAQGKVVVLEWFNPECPFIKLHHEKQTTLADLGKDYGDKNVVILAVNSSNSSNPGYGKDAEAKTNWKIDFPILQDADGKVGHAYGAKTTPHMFVIDKQGVLVYSGAIDNDPRNEKSADAAAGDGKTNYVRAALDEVLAGKPVTTAETKPYGCGVKY